MLIVPKLVVKTLAAILALGLLVFAGTAWLVWWTARQDDRRTSDVIVVLGAAQFDGRPSSVFTARLVHARNLWRDDVAPRIVTVGGNQAGDRYTEASSGKKWLAENGVPESRVTAVETGGDTLSSLEAVEKQMQQDGLVDRRHRHRPVARLADRLDGQRPGDRCGRLADPSRAGRSDPRRRAALHPARDDGLPLLEGLRPQL